jgi:hypothetical protein
MIYFLLAVLLLLSVPVFLVAADFFGVSDFSDVFFAVGMMYKF